MNSVKVFYEKVQADPGIQQKIKEMQALSQEEAINAIIALAKENGFEITMEDILTYARNIQEAACQSGELDEAELDAVAGGGSWKDKWLFYSIASLGIMCFITAMGEALPGPGCGDMDKVSKE